MTDTVLVRIFAVIAPLYGLVIKYLKQASLTVSFTAPAIQNHGQASSKLWCGLCWPRHIMVGAQTCGYRKQQAQEKLGLHSYFLGTQAFDLKISHWSYF